jgi:alpha-tubulin suppressor-like RCC1 family protein
LTAEPPSNTTSPSLSGSAVVGSIIALNKGQWAGLPEPLFSVEWYTCGTAQSLDSTDLAPDCSRRFVDSSSSLGMGNSTSCVVASSGDVYCWGSNIEGRSGDGTTTNRTQPTRVVGVSNATKVVTGGSHSCALTTQPKVYCWGSNSVGQLGNGSTSQSWTATLVSDLSAPGDVFLGGGHSCAIETSDSSVKCWGLNSFGEIGDGTTVNRTRPTRVSGISDAIKVSGGGEHTCYLSTSGTVKCWGLNSSGQLGDGTSTNRTTPVNVSGLSNVVDISAAGGAHTCALKSDGSVWCWGDNSQGALGDGTLTGRQLPVRVLGIESAVQISIDADHSCALLANRNLLCWGNNSNGKIGDGTTTSRAVPTAVIGGTNVMAVEAGGSQTCALFGDSTLRCWGSNSSGQLGTGNTAQSSTPASVIQAPTLRNGNTDMTTPLGSDVGRFFVARVTATNSAGASARVTSSVGPITSAP